MKILEELASLTEDTESFGYHMEYPTLEEVEHFTREVSWDERFEVQTQATRRGALGEWCYTIESLSDILGARKGNNPSVGVRYLDRDELVSWIGDVIGDRVLARNLYRAFAPGESMSASVDTVISLFSTRMRQYREVRSQS